jgi:hypothetical protein
MKRLGSAIWSGGLREAKGSDFWQTHERNQGGTGRRPPVSGVSSQGNRQPDLSRCRSAKLNGHANSSRAGSMESAASSRKLIASAKARPPLIIWNNEHFGLMPPTLSRDHCT